MNKAHFFCSKTFQKGVLSLILIASLYSCVFKNDSEQNKSSEKINTISIVIDDILWKGEIGDTIRNKFACPVIGLPQEEPLFNINQYSIKLLEGFSTNSRNLIIIKKGKQSSFKHQIKQGNKIQINEFQITGKNTFDIISIIEKQYRNITQKMHNTEIEFCQKNLDSVSIFQNSLQKKFRLKIKIPKDYKIVRSRKKFIWLKKEFVGGNASIIVYQIPKKIIQGNTVNQIIQIRDSIGKLYIRGLSQNTNMITENAYAPYFQKIKLDNKSTFETKGTWELKNDFMSGPFLNYCILDNKRNRYLVIEGFCYAPSKNKRDIMFELEAIIKSGKILPRIK